MVAELLPAWGLGKRLPRTGAAGCGPGVVQMVLPFLPL